MDKDSTANLIKSLTDFSNRNRVNTTFDEENFISTFEQLSPHITVVKIHFEHFELVRSRSTQRGTDFENVKQMGYPPAHRVQRLGRCNFVEQSVFYGSSNVETSFLEIGFTEQEPCAVIAQFRLKAGASLTLQPIGELDHYRRHRKPRLDTPGVVEQLDLLLDGLDHYDQITRWFVDAYLADFFSRIPNSNTENNLYEVTSRIANAYLMQADVDGIIYPSVKHAGGLNYAIKPEVFDERFEVVKYALTAPVHAHGYGLFEYFVHAEGNQLHPNGDFLFRTNPHFNARATWPLSADQ